ncbi:Trans-aconitate methyltransferase [Naviculisporaceae sp. PSN 640]
MMSPSPIVMPLASPPSPPRHTPPSAPADHDADGQNTSIKPTSSSPVPDSSFKTYTPSQATTYAERRKGYSPNLYNYILDHHRATGGQNDVLLDVGCGPGTVTRDLAGEFDIVIGVDSGKEMINAANRFGGLTRSGKNIKYYVGEAEGVHEIDELRELRLVPGGVKGDRKRGIDLVTAGTAAHWFDMTKFWESMAKVVRPGGTVALWSLPSVHCHPSTPNIHLIQNILTSFRDDILKPYMLPPSLLNANMYRGIPLPWGLPSTAPFFDKKSFIHRIWDEPPATALDSHEKKHNSNVFSEEQDEEQKEIQFFSGSRRFTLAGFRALAVTMNSVTRWREAHPDLAETKEDVVYQLVERLRKALGRGEEDDLADIWIEAGMSTVLVMVKRNEVPFPT